MESPKALTFRGKTLTVDDVVNYAASNGLKMNPSNYNSCACGMIYRLLTGKNPDDAAISDGTYDEPFESSDQRCHISDGFMGFDCDGDDYQFGFAIRERAKELCLILTR